jgi:hypothetical protein
VGIFVLAACSSGTSGPSGPSGSDAGEAGTGGPVSGADAGANNSGSSGALPTGGSCSTQAIAPNPSGGCAPRLVSPAQCETVDLTGGKTYEFAWTADGSGCETPWTVCVAGNPVTDENSRCVELSTDTSAGISRTGGIIRVSASDLSGLSSSDGTYHWLVSSFYKSHLGSVGFIVRK